MMSRTTKIARDVIWSLRTHRSRSLLMMTGLAVGTAVLSAVMVIGQGTRDAVMNLVQKHGLDMIMVRAGGDVQIFFPQADRGLASLFETDARAMATDVPGIVMTSVVQNQRGINVVAGDRSVTTRAFGVEPDWVVIRRWGVADGEFITSDDMSTMARVVVLGAKVAQALFPDGGAVGQTIRVNNDPYIVKGVFIEMGATAGGDDWDDRVVVPFSTSSRRLLNRPYVEQIVVRVSDATMVNEVADRMRDLLRVRHTIAAGQPDDFFVREPEDVEGSAVQTSSTLQALLVAISVVALLAGGLAIMNLMLAGVAQRSKEIGLRRALGARTSDISQQFLLESVGVAVGGGLAGVVLGVGTALALDLAGVAVGRVTWVPFVVALGACTVIGLVFGVYPARKAATLDPASTLRGRAA